MLSSYAKYPKFWTVEANINRRGTFVCSSNGDTQSTFDNLWGLRIENFLSLHLDVNKRRKILVRRSWIRCGSRSSASQGESKFMDNFGSKNIDSADLRVSCSPGPVSRSDQPVEEPWLLESSISSQHVRQRVASSGLESEDKSLKQHISSPVEEPWLLQPSHIYKDSKSEMHSEISENDVSIESTDALKDNYVSRIILANSSFGTMQRQRVAVLEDERLVEILLESVNEVQAGNVYLGTVTQLRPPMAFVNIGPSCLLKASGRKPYKFPLFSPARNGSSLVEESVQDDSDDTVQNMHVHFGQHETDNEVEGSDDLFKDVNGSLNGSAFASNPKMYLDQLKKRSRNSQPQALSDRTADPENSSDAKSLPVQDMGNRLNWEHVKEGTMIIVQVAKEKYDDKSPTLTPYPNLGSRFWVLRTGHNNILVSKNISGLERTRLRDIARSLHSGGFGLTVRTAAAGHTKEELKKDLNELLSTWDGIIKQATAAVRAADEGVEDAVPVLLHKGMGHILSVVDDLFNDKVKRMVVDSPPTYHEVTNYLQEKDPDLCDRVELYSNSNPLFEEYNIEEEFNSMLNKRVPLSNGGNLVIEQTEALVSIDVNGGDGTSTEAATLDVNLAAAKEIARQIRLRRIGGIIVVDFLDMSVDSHRLAVYNEVRKAVEGDRNVDVSKLSKNGMMTITRQRKRPSLTHMLSEKCPCCHGTVRFEALETSFAKIESEIRRLLAMTKRKPDPVKPKSWPTFILRVDQCMCDYLTSRKSMTLAMLGNSLYVQLMLEVDRGFSRGEFKLHRLTNGTHAKDWKTSTQKVNIVLKKLKGRRI